MQFDRFEDAAHPYGKEIKGFLLIEGWNTKYLLFLISGSLLCGICAIAISAAVGQSLEMALTVGSYACGLASALIALITLLSGIL